MLGVARRVRAWIETLATAKKYWFSVVARRVRAWIETAAGMSKSTCLESHAVCVRGLKH